jgi:hypothetical protein
MAEDRIAALSQRFRRHTLGRPTATPRVRERHSFYLDGALVELVDRTYRDVNHRLHPALVSKSDFLESMIEYGLAHQDAVESVLRDKANAASDAS